MESAPSELVIPAEIWQAVTHHLTQCLPEEGCGLLAGRLIAQGVGRVSDALLVENMLHSPTRFSMQPAAQLQALIEIEERGLDLLAIFHSHPKGPRGPSVTDRAEFGYPGVLAVIFSLPAGLEEQPAEHAWSAGAYRIDSIYDTNAPVVELPLVILKTL